jgi:hypothetical protein
MISAAGNVTGNYILGNGALLTGVITSVANINNGNSNVTVVSSGGNITVGVGGTSNVVVFATTGAYVTGVISASGNITGGNLITGAGAGGNLTGANVISANTVTATGNITGGNINAGNIIIAGDLISSLGATLTIDPATVGNTGLVVINGNLQVNGTTTTINSNVVSTNDLTINFANNAINGAAANGGGIEVGPIGSPFITWLYNSTANVFTSSNGISAVGNITGGNVLTGGLVSATGTVTGSSLLGTVISATGNITGGNITIPGSANISTFIGNAFFGSVPAQPTWYTVAPLNLNNSLAAATKVQLNLINTGGGAGAGSAIDFYTYQISVAAANAEARIAGIDDGNYSAYLSLQTKTPGATGTNGLVERVKIDSTGASVVANVTGGNILTGGLISATGNIQGGNLRTAGLISATGAITGAAITGSSLTVSTGNITGGNLILSGAIVDSAQLDIQTSASNANIVLTPNGTGNVNTGANLSVTGNIQGGNLRTAGLISATGAITGASFSGAGTGLTGTASSLTVGAATSATTAATVTTAAQPNITSVGTLTGLTINNATTAITNGAANGVGNIGTSANSFNVIFAKATSAQYADLAEMYVTDADYPPGTVLEFGGNHEVTISNSAASPLVAGVISTNPAHLMNSTAQGKHLAAIALVGRVPTLVIGPVFKGAMMVSAGNGHAQASATPAMGTVIGKAVEDFAGESGTIEIAVGRL